MEARAALTCATLPHQAVELAEQLVLCWPHARPPDAKVYMAAISATLAAYPLKVAQECCDPRVGLPREREFPPTVVAVVEWCDKRVTYYRTLTAYNEKWDTRPWEYREPEFSEEHRAEMLRKIAEIPGKYFK